MSDVWSAHYATAAGVREWPNEELVRYLGALRVGTILEVGCGNGANLWYLVEHATERVVGLDISAEALDLARTYMAERRVGEGSPFAYPATRTESMGVELILGDCRAIALPTASVDLVVDCMTSQHLSWSDHALAYAEYRRVLRPGGLAWIFHLADSSVIGQDAGRHFDHERVDLFPSVRGFCLPSPGSLRRALGAFGFSVVTRGLSRSYGPPTHYTADYAIVEAVAL